MIEIQLTQGYVAIADDCDADLLAQYKWHVLKVTDSHIYASCKRGSRLLMHRVVMAALKGESVDHINGNTLDNRRSNLRVCTHAQNMANRRNVRSSASGFKGVSYNKRKRRWMASIGGHAPGQKRSYLGSHKSPEAAAAAYDIAAVLKYGEFACLNFPHVFPEVASKAA